MKVELDRLNKLLHQSRVRSHSWQDRLLGPRGSSTCTHTCSPTVQLLAFHQVFVYNFFEVERFRWEGQAALTGGKHTVMFDFKYDGPGFGKGGTGVLSVDGKERPPVKRSRIPCRSSRRSTRLSSDMHLRGKSCEFFSGRGSNSMIRPRNRTARRDLEIGQPINSEECSETAEGVAR